MLQDRIEGKWTAAFAEAFRRSAVAPGEVAAIVSETQSRALSVQLAELALERLGARVFHLVLPSPRQTAPVAVRSTGASPALQGIAPVVAALAGSGIVVDLTVEGLLHAPELPQILAGGARLLMISNEHPEALERLVPDPALEPAVRAAMRRLRAAAEMRVASDSGTDLVVRLAGARVGGVWGGCVKPGQVAHWPGGLVLAFPAAGTVSGRLVLAPGDANLTFKRYIETPVVLEIADDHVVAIGGGGIDAILMREELAAWDDPGAYAVSHVGWGLNPKARWDALAKYDRRDVNGTELRAAAGGFLYSTGANEAAGRYTQAHFDLPMRGCDVLLDGVAVVRAGRLVPEEALTA